MDQPVGDPFRYFWSKGYHDILPVIPADAKGVNSPGKCPGVLLANGKWQGRDRKIFVATEELIKTWKLWGAGVGIRCYNGIVAIDVDTMSEEWSKKIAGVVMRVLGRSAVRIGQYPKTLIVFRAPVTTKYRQIRFQDGVNEKGALVELLAGANCWFVAHGIHPKTGELYRWPDGVPETRDLTFVTAAKLEELFDELKAVLPASKFSGTGGIRGDIDQSTLAAADPYLIIQAFEFVRNDFSKIGYHKWIEMAVALRAALPNDPGTAESLFVEWSEGYVNPQCSAYKMFWSVNPPFKLGAQYIFDKAAEGGWDISNRWFDKTDWNAPPAATEAAPDATKDEEEEEYVSPFAFATQGPPVYDTSDPNRRLRPIPFKEAVEQASTHKSRPLIKGLLDQGAMSVVYGASNAGKTFLCMEMAHCIATGRPFAGKKVQQGAVVYVAAEGGMMAKRRLWALQSRYNDLEIPFFIIPSAIDLRHLEADPGPLVKEIRALGVPVLLIVVDTLSRALAGGDENSPVDMGAIISNGDEIRHHTNAALMYVHHTGKDQARGARGHSSLKAATDAEFEIASNSIECTKQRDGETGWTAAFTLDAIILGVDEDNDPISSCVVKFTNIGGKGKAGAGRPGSYADMVVDAIKQFAGGVIEKDLIIHLQIENDRDGKKKLRAALVRLRGNHRVALSDKGKYTVLSNVFD